MRVNGIYRVDGPHSLTVVADGHLNRMLRVKLDGDISVLRPSTTPCLPGWRFG